MGKLNTKITVDGKMYEVTSHVAAEIKELLTPIPFGSGGGAKKSGCTTSTVPPGQEKTGANEE